MLSLGGADNIEGGKEKGTFSTLFQPLKNGPWRAIGFFDRPFPSFFMMVIRVEEIWLDGEWNSSFNRTVAVSSHGQLNA